MNAGLLDAAKDVAPVLAIMVPLVAAAMTLVMPRRVTPWLPLATGVFLTTVSVFIILGALERGSYRVALGGWPPPVGIALYVDALSATFIALSAVIGLLVMMYTLADFRHAAAGEDRQAYAFWTLLLFLLSGLNLVFLSRDLFNLYVGLEVVGLSAVAMVALTGSVTALFAQMRYLLFATAGSLFYLMGVALLYGAFGALDITIVAATITASPAAPAAAFLMTIGLLIKTAIWPMHFWLPQAHANAPPPVSAMLSGLVVKASLYLIVRLWTELFEPVLPVAAWTVLGLLGAAAVLWGSTMAFRQRRLKLMIAYSTVAQLGYMMFLFPLFTHGGAIAGQAWAGTLLQIVSHGIAKAAMFLSAGALVIVLGSDERSKMVGASRVAPVPVFALALAGLSIIALPPSGGFLAKWLLLRASILAEAWWLVAILVVGSFLAAAYLFRFLLPALSPPAPSASENAIRTGWRGGVAITLAVISVALGIASAPLLEFVTATRDVLPWAVP